jgi:Na+/H+ antiporter NhaD/arsenite permease-like protein
MRYRNFLFCKKNNFKIGNLPVKGGAQREHFPFLFLKFLSFDITGVLTPVINPPKVPFGGLKKRACFII